MLTRTEHIRRVLEKNFDMSAAQIQDMLATKGVEVEVGHIYATRHSLKKEREEAERQQKLEAEKQRQQREAEAAKRRQEQEAEQAKLKAMAAKAQQTKALNPKPLREHIVGTLVAAGVQGLTIAEIISRCRQTYKLLSDAEGATPEEEEAFRQSVRKKLRMLVLNKDVNQNNDKFTLALPVLPVSPEKQDVDVRREVTENGNGIAFLVGKLKEVVGKLGRNETKELIDVL